MKKINVVLGARENKILKYGKDKIEIKTYIGTVEQMQVLDICMQQFTTPQNSLPIIKAIFNLAIIGLQTNLQIPELDTSSEKTEYALKVDLTYGAINHYENSDIYDKVLKEIINYDSLWDMVIKSIEMHNTLNAFGAVVDSLPNEKAISDSLSMVNEFIQTNPEFTKEVMREEVIDRAVKAATEEYKATKKKNKKVANEQKK